MMELTAGDVGWLLAVAAAVVLFAAPVIIAAARRAEPIGLVLLLTALGITGICWVAALVVACTLPRARPPVPRYPAVPPRRL
jgi:hypothetical protein